MSVNAKMTAIADKIRALLGFSGTMGLDTMASHLETEQTNIRNAFAAAGNKGGTVPEAQVSGDLAAAINSIPEGVTVQRITGTFTTGSDGTAGVVLDFIPDLLVVNVSTHQNKAWNLTYAPAENNTGLIQMGCEAEYENGIYMSDCTIGEFEGQKGFSIWIKAVDFSWNTLEDAKNATFTYTAVKYTAS